jgi:hypothetical protein
MRRLRGIYILSAPVMTHSDLVKFPVFQRLETTELNVVDFA